MISTRKRPTSIRPARWKVTVGNEHTTALFDPSPASPRDTLLVLAHGAGGHMEHRTMSNLTSVFQSRGVHVVRFNFLYKEKKAGPPDRMPGLMECFAAVVEKVRQEIHPAHLFLGGHSMGGRTASMMAADGFECDGLILLAYPLHPAGQPQKLRDAHLGEIVAPVLCLNGTRDDLCRKDLMEKVVGRLPSTFAMHWLEAADHGFHVLKRSGRTDADVLNEIGDVSRGWVSTMLEAAG